MSHIGSSTSTCSLEVKPGRGGLPKIARILGTPVHSMLLSVSLIVAKNGGGMSTLTGFFTESASLLSHVPGMSPIADEKAENSWKHGQMDSAGLEDGSILFFRLAIHRYLPFTCRNAST